MKGGNLPRPAWWTWPDDAVDRAARAIRRGRRNARRKRRARAEVAVVPRWEPPRCAQDGRPYAYVWCDGSARGGADHGGGPARVAWAAIVEVGDEAALVAGVRLGEASSFAAEVLGALDGVRAAPRFLPALVCTDSVDLWTVMAGMPNGRVIRGVLAKHFDLLCEFDEAVEEHGAVDFAYVGKHGQRPDQHRAADAVAWDLSRAVTS